MIEKGFESRVKIQQIIDNQLPSYILDESPKMVEFLKQYYISQEHQGGSVDIAENLDQYSKLDNLVSNSKEDDIFTVGVTTSGSDNIYVNSTKGFPEKYGLIKINDEIITYTGIGSTVFEGCKLGRGFSGITNYHKNLDEEELVFSTSSAADHDSGSKVENISSLFLKEFYKKFKKTFVPGLENVDLNSEVNVGNFLKNVRNLYEAKGTNESFRILFNVLYGVSPTVVNLEEFLLKPSSSEYIRREVILVEAVSGNPNNLIGQTIKKLNDESTNASVSEVEIFTRNNKQYYKISLFVGYEDASAIEGNFIITPNTKVLESVSSGETVISVDSTVGFPAAGTVVCEDNIISYENKTLNQFLNCTGVETNIAESSTVRTNDIYFGYEDGDTSKKVEFKILGVLSEFVQQSDTLDVEEGDTISVSNLGEVIQNKNSNKKEIFANSWIYNTSTRHEIDSFISGSQLLLKSSIDKSSLKVGDPVEILLRSSGQSVLTSFIKEVNISTNTITLNDSSQITGDGSSYDLRRKIRKSESSGVSINLGNDKIISDVLNVYNDNDSYFYVASNSLPSSDRDQEIDGISLPYSYKISKNINKIINSNLTSSDKFVQPVGVTSFARLKFDSELPFRSGDKIYYSYQNTPIVGLDTGAYFVEVLNSKTELKFYYSPSFIVSGNNYIPIKPAIENGDHTFSLYSQRSDTLGLDNSFKKFPLDVNNSVIEKDKTVPGSIGLLINGVKIENYKSKNTVYYGPIKNINIGNSGEDYDVINPPLISISNEGTSQALVQPVLSGSISEVYADSQDFDIERVVSIGITGGNGSGAVLEPVLTNRVREVSFDGRTSENSGGINTVGETITCLTNHNFENGQQIIYSSNGNLSIGVGAGTSTLVNNAKYYVRVLNNKSVRLYENIDNYNDDLNPVGFSTINTKGIHKLILASNKKTLSNIRVIDGGSGYTNRKLIVKQSNIDWSFDEIKFDNHNFNDGDLIEYEYETSAILGLSTNKQYYVLKSDSNSFKLSDAGIGGTDISNYNRRKSVNLGGSGSGYQYFKYPDVTAFLEYNPVGFGTTTQQGQLITLTPSVKGNIVDAYLYEPGTGYGSSVINFEKSPVITIKTGKDARLRANIIGGQINSVSVEYGGSEYYSVPDIVVTDSNGVGSGAKLRAVILNGRITEVKVISSGIGYSKETISLQVKSLGSNAKLFANIRDLTIDNVSVFGSEILSEYNDSLRYSVAGYSEDFLNEDESHSKIIGWSFDGNPIYGPYGYANPNDRSTTRIINSSYSKNLSNITDRPSSLDFDLGDFVEDYKFDNSGDLDEHNGRFTKTPEFPNGVYAYFATIDSVTKSPIFPYFIGNTYKSEVEKENFDLNQSFDINNSNLIRNTFPYKVSDLYASYDFVPESKKVSNQKAKVESISDGNIVSFDIKNSGDNYKVNDLLNFDDTDTSGSGLSARVSELKGKQIESIELLETENYENSIFEWRGDEVKVNVLPSHSLKDGDYVSISGLSTNSKFNNLFQIGVSTNFSQITKDTPSMGSGFSTEIYVSSIPNNVSIGSSLRIGANTLSILDIFRDLSLLRVKGNISNNTSGTSIEYIPDHFNISVETEYFDSKPNNKIYFNPTESVGFGNTIGFSTSTTFKLCDLSVTRDIPIQSIYVKNHPFKSNQKVSLTTPSSYSNLRYSDPSTSSVLFDLPSTNLYVINKGNNLIGIKTGLSYSEVFLHGPSSGSFDADDYLLETNFEQVTGKVSKIISQVSVSTAHGLSNGDKVKLSVQPNLNVGIGTSTSVTLFTLLNDGDFLLADNNKSLHIDSVDLNNNTITSTNNYNTGDKVLFGMSPGEISGLISDTFYFIFKVDDNTFKLCETYSDSVKNPPITIDFTSKSGTFFFLNNVNPRIKVTKGNNLVSSNIELFTDNEFKNKFVSTGSTTNFNVVSSGSTITINYSENLPTKLYYNREHPIISGSYIRPHKDVKNYNEILYVDSIYENEYTITGVGETTFTINLIQTPERSSYKKNECNIFEYTTKSKTSTGGISNIKILSSGSGYKKLPSFVGSASTQGNNALITPVSNTIGKVKELRILNENFDYPSDKTLRPKAFISPVVTIKNSNTIGIVSVTSGGSGYIYSPSITIFDEFSKSKITSGLLRANLTGNSISSIENVINPRGLSENEIKLYATNNSNGISIVEVQSNSSGIFTCYISTPPLGFSTNPFKSGDLVFVEGITKNGSNGLGFNSEDYDFKFILVKEFDDQETPNNKLVLDVTEYTNNTGIANTIQSSVATVVHQDNYPSFVVNKEPLLFIKNETLIVNDIDTDLVVSQSEKTFIKIYGSYSLDVGDILTGKDSGTIATVDGVNSNNLGEFLVNYSLRKDNGWSNNTGFLSEDTQVMPDNDYYQNLSYTVKSPIEYEKLRSPVNEILHTIGTKNFSDTGITSSPNKVTVNGNDSTSVIYDIIEEDRVDTLRGFDFVRDYEIIEGSSKFIEFKNKTLSSFIKINSDLVFSIDNINSQFNNLEDNPDTFLNVEEISSFDSYKNYLIRLSNSDNSQLQLTEITVLKDSSNSNNTILQRGNVFNKEGDFSSEYGTYSLETDDATNIDYIQFTPADKFDTDYDLKLLTNNFTSSQNGIGTESVGFIELTNAINIIPQSQTSTIIGANSDKIESLYANIQVIDTSNNNMNFVELYLTHDGQNTFMSESYFDSTSFRLTQDFIGEFNSNIDDEGNLSLSFTNSTSSNNINLRSKIIGIGSTSVGIGTYSFKSLGQPDSSVRSVIYQSDYSVGTGITEVISLDSTLFDSFKSVVQVGCGDTKSVHQILSIHDGTSTFTEQCAFITVNSSLPNSEFSEYDNTSGLGTFGSEYDNNRFVLKFYPDSSFETSEIQVSSFNQCFYTSLDQDNIPLNLNYNNSTDYVFNKLYNAPNGDRVNVKEFDIKKDGIPIFAKTFNPNDSNTISLGSSIFTIENHFFRNNEELIYTPKSTFIGIGSTPMQYRNDSVGLTSTVPTQVFAIVETENTFKISTTRNGTPVNIIGVGTGNAHQFEMAKKNEKTLITLDNIVQYPLTFTPINYFLKDNIDSNGIGTDRTIFSLSGISSIQPKDILRIDDEYMEVINVGFGTTSVGPITGIGTTSLVEVSRAFVGSSSTSHANTSGIATVYRGSYNIVGSKIFFTDAPRGKTTENINTNNLVPDTSDFTGRVYFRNNYSTNRIFDDISHEFTGIARTFSLSVSGVSTTGIGTTQSSRSGIVFINGLFQTPTTDNNPSGNYIVSEDSINGISTITFAGIKSTTDALDIFTSSTDVNVNDLPRGGIIVSLGSTPGLGYAPLVGAAITPVIDGGVIQANTGTGLTDNHGSGYSGIVSITVYDPTEAGELASISASVGVGGTLTFSVDQGGANYSDQTRIFISEPSYDNLDIIGVSRIGIGTTTDTGIGLKVSAEVSGVSTNVGIGSTLFEVSNFKITRPGYSFRRGDKFTLSGLVTASGLSEPVSNFELEVLSTYTDSFAMWEFGELDYVDSIKNYQNGVRTRFPLFYNNGELLSFEANRQEIDINYDNLLLVFINGVLQEPKVAYEFTGGTSFRFKVPPKSEDNVDIFFYKGTENDDTTTVTDIQTTLEVGDSVRIVGLSTFEQEQTERIVYNISSSDKIETQNYNGTGLEDIIYRPLNIIKKKSDQKLNGEVISKVRDSLEPYVYPTAKIIQNVESSGLTEIYVDNSEFFNSNVQLNEEFDAFIILGSGDIDPVSPEIVPTVSSSSTISALTITNPGQNLRYSSDYIGLGNTVNISIPKPPVRTATAKIGVNTTNGIGSSFTLNPNSLVITNGGLGYTQAPTVTISQPDLGGIQAVGIASINSNNGTVISVGFNTQTDSWCVGTGATIGFGYSDISLLRITFSDPSPSSAIATAVVSAAGTLTDITLIEGGFGYSQESLPKISTNIPIVISENITGFAGNETKGYSGIVTGIGTTSIGNDLALKFDVEKTTSGGNFTDLQVGYPVYVFDTVVGNGITSIYSSGIGTVGIGTTFVDNIYHVAQISYNSSNDLGIITCYIHSDTDLSIGIGTTGSKSDPVGRFSWGLLKNSSGLTRSSNPISIGVTGLTVDSGLSTFPTIQRRGSGIGIRDTGALKK